MFSIAILLFDGVEIASIAPPYQVFSAAQQIYAASNTRRALFRCFMVAEQLRPMRAAGGMKLLPDCVLIPTPELDVLVVPGGDIAPLQSKAPLIGWIRMQASGAVATLGINEGEHVLSAAGLSPGALQGRRMPLTSRWFPAAPRHANVPLQGAAKILTAHASAAATSSLHLVARLAGPELARLTALHLHIEWNPDDESRPEQAATSCLFSAA